MFKKQREVLYNVVLSVFWNFLINYKWATLINGQIISEEKHKWLVQLENGRSKNIQIVEMTFDERVHKLNIKITPAFNKHQSNDLVTISLLEQGDRTMINMSY